jgi:hypothetical protein
MQKRGKKLKPLNEYGILYGVYMTKAEAMDELNKMENSTIQEAIARKNGSKGKSF